MNVEELLAQESKDERVFTKEQEEAFQEACRVIPENLKEADGNPLLLIDLQINGLPAILEMALGGMKSEVRAKGKEFFIQAVEVMDRNGIKLKENSEVHVLLDYFKNGKKETPEKVVTPSDLWGTIMNSPLPDIPNN